MESIGEPVTTSTSAAQGAQPPPPHDRSQAASIVSLRIPQLASGLNTAATSMLTVCEDEKDAPMAEMAREREDDVEAGGDDGAMCVREATPPEPQMSLTFLLVTGSRKTMSFNPETTVGRVKELVWNAWPSDWMDEKPSAPSYLRILYLGKILQDEDTLAVSLSTSPTSPVSIPAAQTPQPTIVHLSIRPYAPVVEDEAMLKKNFRAARRALTRSGSTHTPDPPITTGMESTNDDARTGGCCGCIIC